MDNTQQNGIIQAANVSYLLNSEKAWNLYILKGLHTLNVTTELIIHEK